jgi:metal-dependent amidase/aminoacylase/carboxypeptidase family protein
VTKGVGGFGVIAVLENGPEPDLMLRTDMDALPVQKQTDLPYASTSTAILNDGTTVPFMHACGHDVHMTVLVGNARRLVAERDTWLGTLLLIAQPAEERGAGARQMLADGLFKRFPRPDYNLVLHVSAELPAGVFGYIIGYAMVNVDSVDINDRGIGGHGTYPHKTKDPVVLAAQLILQLQTIISDSFRLQLTVRSCSYETREYLLRRIKEISNGLARTAGLPEILSPEVTIRDEYTLSVFNDPELADRVVSVLRAEFGDSRVQSVPPVMAGEGFSRYGRTEPPIPSKLFWPDSVDPERFAERLTTHYGEHHHAE